MSDGSDISVNVNPSGDIGTNYVLNNNLKKIHYASCSSVDDMKEADKAFTNDYD